MEIFPELAVAVRDVASMLCALGYHLVRIEAQPRKGRSSFTNFFRMDRMEMDAVLDAYHCEASPLYVNIKALRLAEIKLRNLQSKQSPLGCGLTRKRVAAERSKNKFFSPVLIQRRDPGHPTSSIPPMPGTLSRSTQVPRFASSNLELVRGYITAPTYTQKREAQGH